MAVTPEPSEDVSKTDGESKQASFRREKAQRQVRPEPRGAGPYQASALRRGLRPLWPGRGEPGACQHREGERWPTDAQGRLRGKTPLAPNQVGG